MLCGHSEWVRVPPEDLLFIFFRINNTSYYRNHCKNFKIGGMKHERKGVYDELQKGN